MGGIASFPALSPMRLTLLALALLARTATLATAQSPVTATIDRAVDAWSRVKTARATFDQTLTNPLTGGTLAAHGEFQQERPNRLSIRFTDPAGDRIVADGKDVWFYLPSTAPGQVIRQAVGASGASAATPLDITGEFLDAPRDKYDIADGGREAVDGAASRVLVLTPKPGVSAPFVRAKVWVLDRDATIRQFELTEPSGVARHVRLTSLALNVPVDRGAFTFTPPKGVKVIDQMR